MPTAREGIDYLKGHLEPELKYVDLPDTFMGACGFAVPFGQTEYAVVSVERDSPEHFAVTSGLLKELQTDRRKVLEYCNTETANNPGCPIYTPLGGTEVILQWRSPIAIIARTPELLTLKINETPTYAAQKRDDWLRQEIVGNPFSWNEADLDLLFTKATMATP